MLGVTQLSGFAAASPAFLFRQTISSNTDNYNLKSAAIAAGWNQIDPLDAEITINNGVLVGSSSVSNYSFETGSSFPAGTMLKLTNNGQILGRGGASGSGAGGPALRAQAAISIWNNGTIGGGGNGGANGSNASSQACNSTIGDCKGIPCCTGTCQPCTAFGGAGGVGAGSQNNGVAQNGSAGSSCGDICATVVTGGTGANGSPLGSAAAVVSSGLATLIVTGTIYGSVS